MQGSIGNYLIVLGILLILAGLMAKTGLFGWFGHLPGDIRIEREHSRFYLPITSMLLASIVLSVGLSIVRRFFS